MLLAVTALLLQASPASDGIPAAATAVSYVEQCIAATGVKGVDLDAIEAQGWRSMNATDRQGRPLPIVALSRSTDMSVLMASAKNAKSIECVLLIPTNGSARAGALREALGAKFGAPPSRATDTQVRWIVGTHRIALSPMGKAANPAGVKIQVTVEKK